MFWFILVVQFLTVQTQTEVPLTEPEVDLTTTSIKITTSDIPLSTIENFSLIKVIDEFRTLKHEVSSGKIMIIGNNSFHIPNFHFDGKAPTAFFIVGKGDTVTIENATIVYLNGSTSPLPAFDGQSIKLVLPEGLTVQNIDWLAVWCKEYKENLGYVYINKVVYPYPPQTFNLNNIVKSGPVVLVNKKNLFIPNFTYCGNHKNVHFWVGNGSEPSSNGIAIPDESGSSENLHAYQGQNLNIVLPDNITTDNIDYFGVWSIDEEISLGHVPIKGILAKVPEASRNSTISMRLPKCCSFGYIITSDGCQQKPSVKNFQPTFKIYEHNETHFSNESLDYNEILFEPYNQTPTCESGKYALDEKSEEFAILQNSSLLIKGAIISGILSTDKFCLENIEDDNNSLEMKIFVCVPEYKIQKAMFITYVSFTIISTFCFAITFFLYFFWLKVEDIHRKCFTFYVFCMTITFLTLTIVQTAKVENSGCEVLGFFFQFFMIASFTLLGILCFDILIIIKHINEKQYESQRKLYYMAVALGVPTLFLFISLCRNLTPDVPNSFFKPQYLQNNCYFEEDRQRIKIFYIPICISIAVGFISLVMTKIEIVKNDKDKINDFFWIDKGVTYKFMFRQCFLTWVIMTVSWISNVLMSSLDESSGIFNAAIIFEALQGVLIVAVFTMNHYGSNYVENKKKNRQTANVEMLPLNTKSCE